MTGILVEEVAEKGKENWKLVDEDGIVFPMYKTNRFVK
jgi:hypothetical protein